MSKDVHCSRPQAGRDPERAVFSSNELLERHGKWQGTLSN